MILFQRGMRGLEEQDSHAPEDRDQDGRDEVVASVLGQTLTFAHPFFRLGAVLHDCAEQSGVEPRRDDGEAEGRADVQLFKEQRWRQRVHECGPHVLAEDVCAVEHHRDAHHDEHEEAIEMDHGVSPV
ncbi:MAG: putative hypothetical protein [Podoviridae sp. ctda_1]|nr:MAG: putative hypothetical protein [Podoviridae sp. ctda_1]